MLLSQLASPVRDDPDEVRDAGDLEDLAIVVREAFGLELDPVTAALGKQPDEQRDAGRVDVRDVAEVESDDPSFVTRRLGVGRFQGGLRAAVDVALELDDSGLVAEAVRAPQSDSSASLSPLRRKVSSTVWRSPSVQLSMPSVMCSIRNRPQPRGF